MDNTDLKGDSKSHIGIANIRTRLSQLPECSLDIKSTPGKGTKAVIKINTEKRRERK